MIRHFGVLFLVSSPGLCAVTLPVMYVEVIILYISQITDYEIPGFFFLETLLTVRILIGLLSLPESSRS